MSELRFEELPGIPKMWIDFLRSRLSFLPASLEIQTLPAHANEIASQAKRREEVISIIADGTASSSARSLENIQKLRQPGSVAVIANFYLNILGGPIFQIWKCLTAIKVCEMLGKQGISAVPVCWISTDPPPHFSACSTSLLDPDSELCCLQIPLQESMDFFSQAPLLREQIYALPEQIEDLGKGTFDTETIDILRSAFASQDSTSSMSARLISRLTGEWGMVVLDAGAAAFEPVIAEAHIPIRDCAKPMSSQLNKRKEMLTKEGQAGECSEGSVYRNLVQSLVLPVAVSIVDPSEICAYSMSLPMYSELGILRPGVWPQCSATVLDVRSRRILERYDLSIHQLFSGEDKVIRTIRERTPGLATQRLDELRSEAESLLHELSTSDFNGVDFVKSVQACKEKVVYQLGKLRDLSISGRERKEAAMRRQIHKTCNFLAPRGSVQERELAGILIPLRYSLAGLRFLYEKLDILTLEHQLISMD